MKLEELVKPNDDVYIIEINNESSNVDDSVYNGKTGKVLYIDSANQIHGTWGGLALIPDKDSFYVVGKVLFLHGEYKPLND